MNSLTDKFNQAKDYVVKKNPTLGLSMAFALVWSVMGPSPVSYENYDANIVSKTAIHATSFAGKTGLIYGGFLLGGLAGRRLTGRSDPQTQMFAGSVGASLVASLGSSLVSPYVDVAANAVFAANDVPAHYEESQYAAADSDFSTVELEDGRLLSYNAKENVLKIG